MKKIILGFGTIGAIAAPVAAVVSCGTTTANLDAELAKTKNLMSSKDKVALATSVGTKVKGDVLTPEELGLVSAPEYGSGVTVVYAVESPDNGGFLKVNVTLSLGDKKETKAIIITASDALPHNPEVFKAAEGGKILFIEAAAAGQPYVPAHSQLYYIAPKATELKVKAPKENGTQSDFIFTWKTALPETGEATLTYNDGTKDIDVKAHVKAITTKTFVLKDDSGPYAIETATKYDYLPSFEVFTTYNLFTTKFKRGSATAEQLTRIVSFAEYLANGDTAISSWLVPTPNSK